MGLPKSAGGDLIDTAPQDPDAEVAAAIAKDVLGTSTRVVRFPAGLRHFVYEAVSDQDRAVVVRVSRRDDADVVQDALYWSELLRPFGVPLPKVLRADVTMKRHPFPYVVLERLPGRDVGFVIEDMSSRQQRALVHRLIEFQTIVAELPAGRGYGFAPRLHGPFLHSSWEKAITASLQRSRVRIRAAGIVGEQQVDRVEYAAQGLAHYFATVKPTPFLHDITTKNVIVDRGQLSGIVDVDDLCFGDPLFLVGLIRMALLANGHCTAYAEAWTDALQPDADQLAALNFYTALFCVDFMGELGHRFNRARAQLPDDAYVKRLNGILDRYLGDPISS